MSDNKLKNVKFKVDCLPIWKGERTEMKAGTIVSVISLGNVYGASYAELTNDSISKGYEDDCSSTPKPQPKPTPKKKEEKVEVKEEKEVIEEKVESKNEDKKHSKKKK